VNLFDTLKKNEDEEILEDKKLFDAENKNIENKSENNEDAYEKYRKLRNEIKRFGVDFRHFNGIIYKDNVSYNAVGFELGEKIASDYMNKTYNIVYYPEKIILNDEEVTQIILKSIKENK